MEQAATRIKTELPHLIDYGKDANKKREDDEEDYEDEENENEYYNGIINGMRNRFNGSSTLQAAQTEWQQLQDDLNRNIEPGAVLGKIQIPQADAAITLKRTEKQYRLPLSLEDAKEMYAAMDPSTVGVEYRGDVLDPSLRKSHEVVADAVILPEALATFDFPEELKRIHTSLCPSAEHIRVQPYKVILYGKDDFFVPHRDSMDCTNMFGTISLILPMSEEAVTDGKEADEASRHRWSSEVEHVGEHGQLVLYAGYNSSDMSRVSMCPSSTGEARAANSLTYTVDMEALASICNESGDALVVMNYGSWTGDVLHEVRKLSFGYRASITYRLYKEGHIESFVPLPLRTETEGRVRSIMSKLVRIDGSDDTFHLGFSLRHAYPPAGLVPSALKGIDAVVYSIVSRLYDVYLFTGYEARFAGFKDCHTLSKDPYDKLIFLTTNAQTRDFSGDTVLRDMQVHPSIKNTLWVQLGYGCLLGGGHCYGNADCGTDWWYRQAYLLLSHKSAAPSA